jgi:DNA-binding beta-propeller fold protein YncE
MWRRGLAIGFVVLAVASCVGCQGLSTDHPSSAPSLPSPEILYIIDNLEVTTYAVDLGTLEPTIVGATVNLAPASSSLIQLVPSPNDHFLYNLWSDNQQQEHLTTYATETSGVPELPPLQTVEISSLSQLNIDPNGNFAYVLKLVSTSDSYTSTIFVFEVEPSGILRQPPQVQGIYGPSLMPTLLDGLSPDGSQLYLVSQNVDGPVYSERAINPVSGTLGPDVIVFRPPVQDSVLFGAKLIVDYRNAMDCSWPRYVNIMRNEPDPPQPLIQCGSAMFSACGSASNIQLDPSGIYLFLSDAVSQEVRVGKIDLPAGVVKDTGSLLPLLAQTPGFAFSPDGILVYALLASDLNLHIYRFDPIAGTLTEGSTSISMSAGSGFLPALRH